MAHFWKFHFKPGFVLAERENYLNTSFLSHLLNYNDIETFFFPQKKGEEEQESTEPSRAKYLVMKQLSQGLL